MSDQHKTKLIEVALPLDAINEASRREKSPFTKNHPRALHVWWARRPLAACRAVLFASLVDDPSSHPDAFPTEQEQVRERERLFAIIEQLVKWENSNDEEVLAAAHAEILRSTLGQLPVVLDPFCGGGSIPLEAQRLGLKAHASDLNPVAALITKALVEVPPPFSNRPPENPTARAGLSRSGSWTGALGLAEDVRYYGGWIRDMATESIGDLYPRAKLPTGGEAPVAAWIWARTVTCPNPACGITMPLVRTFSLSTKKGKEASLNPRVGIDGTDVLFDVVAAKGGPGTVERTGATCLACGTSVPLAYVRSEGRAGRIGQQLLAIVAETPRGRVYLRADQAHVDTARQARPEDAPDTDLPTAALGFRVQAYGMLKHRDLFTPRQLVALITLTDLVSEARDDLIAGGSDSDYADAVATFLALAISRLADFSNSLCSWDAGNTNMRQLFSRQTISMAWDFAETNPLQGVVSVDDCTGWAASAIERFPYRPELRGVVQQLDAARAVTEGGACVSTDPPYYDNIGYADLSDFFYIWLRRSLRNIHPDLFSTVLTPKSAELIANPHRFDTARAADHFFEEGLRESFGLLRRSASGEIPMTVYYAFKQTEDEKDGTGVSSTGWETMLKGLLESGFAVTGTWPIRTEQQQRTRAANSNALASSIVLVCRPRPVDAPVTTRRDFVSTLRAELPSPLRALQHGHIAPVDLAQAAIGPGMAIFSRYQKVVEADGSEMTVRIALALINHALDEVLAAQESDLDPDTRFAVAWFEQSGNNDGPFGDADILARAKNTSVQGLVDAGLLRSRGGKVRLLKRSELVAEWDPAADRRLTVWEVTQHLVKRLEDGGEGGAADLLRRVGGLGETARELSYRLYAICERKGWAQDALGYNGLAVSWPEIARLAAESPTTIGQQTLEV